MVDATMDRAMGNDDIDARIEAVLMVADRPVSAQEFAQVLGVDVRLVRDALLRLQDEYDGDAARGVRARGFALRHTAKGWRLTSRVEYEDVASLFAAEGRETTLSQAALESLAIIAYRQPVTRARVASIRGVNSDGVIRTLMIRGLIREDGYDADSHATLLATSDMFLEKMGLNSLDDLPDLAPFMPALEGADDDSTL